MKFMYGNYFKNRRLFKYFFAINKLANEKYGK